MGRPKKAKTAQPIKNEIAIQNGLGEAVGYGLGGGINPIGFPGGCAPEISQANGLFKNLRYYLVSNFRQMLSEAYVELGLIQTIVDVPVDDALRGGITIKSKQLSEEQLEELKVSIDRDDDLNTAGSAAKWNRLFGGAGILILTDQDPETPLEIETISIETPLEFRACDMWELFWDKQNSEGYDPALQAENFDFYNYYGEQVHKSRVMRLKGISAPSFIRPRLRGWGFSVVETLVRSINQYLKATDLGFEVLDEFKLDVYKIKNLVNTLMSPQGEEAVRRRVQLANWQKNYQNAVVMDSEDDFDHKQLSFAGLAEAMQGIRMQVASDMRMPLTKLFGISASGFNSGEDDIEVYNSMVESQVRNKIKYPILRILEVKCQQLFGMIPDDLSLEFAPLRVMSSEQEENVKTSKFTRVLQARQAGELTTEEFRSACNKSNLFDISLDPADTVGLGGDLADTVSEGANDPDSPKDTDDPGAGRADTRKSRATETGGLAKGPGKPPAPKSADAPEVKGEAPETGDKRRNAEWDESKHPRADDGKFGEGGGGSKDSGKRPLVSDKAIRRDKAVSGDTETKQLIKETKPVFDALGKDTPALAQGVRAWSAAAYAYVRDIQRKGKTEHGPDAQRLGEQTLKDLDEHFSKLPNYAGPLVRDVSLDIDEVRGIYGEGSEHVLDAYTSFTARDTYLTRRKVRLQVDQSTAGKAAWGLCENPEEAEVVVPKGVKYRVKKIEERDEAPYMVVHLEEVSE